MVGRSTFIGFISLLFAVFPAIAEEQPESPSDYDRFQLWNQCRPMDINIFLNDGARKIGVKEERVLPAVRSRLRAARLFDKASDHSSLMIDIRVAGRAFAVSTEYQKPLFDNVSKTWFLETTWWYRYLGTHGDSPDYILTSIPSLMDKFLDEYLRVNELVCQ